MSSKERFSKLTDPLFRDLNIKYTEEELECLKELIKHIRGISKISSELKFVITNVTLKKVTQLLLKELKYITENSSRVNYNTLSISIIHMIIYYGIMGDSSIWNNKEKEIMLHFLGKINIRIMDLSK
jgi:hypothetical protein